MTAASNKPPDDAELHAYVDGLLDPARAAAVEARLAADPVAREQVAAWRRQNVLILRLAAPPAGEPLPPGLKPARLAQRRQRERRRMAAAVVLALLAGGGAVWLAQAPWQTRAGALDALFLEDIEAYRALSASLDPGDELDAEDPKVLAGRLSRWLGQPVVAPDLTRFELRLVGAQTRRVPKGDHVALLTYEDEAAARFMLYLLHPEQPPAPVPHQVAGAPGRAVYWPYDELRCVLIGDAAPDRLQAMARVIDTQIEEAEEG